MATKFGRRDSSRFTTAGRLKHRVKLLGWVETPKTGSVTTDCHYPELCEVWADVEPLNDLRMIGDVHGFQGDRTVTHRVTIRHRKDMDACSFVSWCRDGHAWMARVESAQDMDHAGRFVSLLVRVEDRDNHINERARILPV